MVPVAVDFHASDNFLDFTIYSNVQIAFTPHGFEEFTIVTLTTAYQRSEDENPFSLIVMEDHIDDLLFGIFHHLLASHVAICLACTGKEQSQIVVDLGCSAYSRTGITVGGLLLDTDDWRQSCNLVDIRPFHASQEIAGIG